MNLNKEQITGILLGLFATTGPLASWLVTYTKLDGPTVQAVLSLAQILTPSLIVPALIFLFRDSAKVASVAHMEPAAQQVALSKVPDEAKVAIAAAIPDVAAIVVKDTATDGIAAVAAAPEQPKVLPEAAVVANVHSTGSPTGD